MELWKSLNGYKTKEQIVFFSKRKKKSAMRAEISFRERERESSFSLDFSPFGPSVLDGARSKVDLRDEGYAWTPIW